MLKRKIKVKIGIGVLQFNQRLAMLPEPDGPKLWCVRCKWKSTPCVLHFNLTSFHYGPNSLIHTRVCDIRCGILLSSILSSCVFLDFSPATTIKHISAIFAPKVKWKKGKPMIKRTHITRRKDTILFTSFYTRLNSLTLMVVMYPPWNEGEVSSRKKNIHKNSYTSDNTPSNDREIH